MTRVVVDTNVLVSALIAEHGSEAAVLDLVVAGKLYWCISEAILTEYRDVLTRPKFARIPWWQIEMLLKIAAAGYRVFPPFTLKESFHEPDNRFLECAQAARADYLITGNKRHFPEHWKTTRIVNARELLGAFKD